MLRPGAFLDRDDTINRDSGYVSSPDELDFLPGAVEALRILNGLGRPVAVITNQAGVAHGLHSEDDVQAFNAEMNRRLGLEGAHIDRFYHCPHHPEGQVARYRRHCDCRKPGNALYRRAITDLGIDPGRSWAIGDKLTDLQPAVEMGATGVLICDAVAPVGAGGGEVHFLRVGSLLDAVRLLRDRDIS